MTKYIIVARDKGRPIAAVVMDRYVFEVVAEFVYLGTLLICDNDYSFFLT